MERTQTRSAETRDLADRSNRLLDAVDELRDLEQQKRRETISTPPFHHLADDVKDKSREIFRMADAQESAGDRVATQTVSIADVDAQSDR
ncbi:MAG TPA: hypothetical protein VFK35_10220 [Candidatus Limnocylindrales bacterium]|nr:hypothetical protein [Candidatus Limnocylindrales bacterium]